MARVHRTHHGVRSSETPRIDRSRAVRKKKPYKILLEAVTKEKKKLHSVLSYTADAPRGYSFVPAGNPDLTEYCKEVCRRRGLNVYIVSAKPKNKAHANPDKISHHVHRLGHHFPNKVIDEACDVLGYLFRGGTYEKSTRMLDSSRLARSLAVHGNRMRLHDRPVTDTETKEQIRAAIRDLFPKIPEDDLTSIVKHAFREGTNRVGNASELPLARRVQLAVVAHIRHCYTDYDHLLKTGTWQEARAKVEQTSLAQLMKWRDEEDNDELEETFREVIILDDDDDDEEDSEDTLSGGESREPSLEIVSSQAAAHELQPNDLAEVEWIDPHNMNRAPGKAYFLRPIRRVVSSARSGPSHVYSAPKAASRPIVDDRARGGHTSSAFSHAHPRPLPLIHPAEARLNYRHEPHEGPRLMEPLSKPPALPPARSDPPLQYWGPDGKLYDLHPLGDSYNSLSSTRTSRPAAVEYNLDPDRSRLAPSSSLTSHHPQEAYVLPPYQATSPNRDYQPHSIPAPPPIRRRISEQDVVLPSIERDIREPESILSPRGNPAAPQSPRHDRNSVSVGNHAVSQNEVPTPKRKSLQSPLRDHLDHFGGPTPKRRRPAQVDDDRAPRLNNASEHHKSQRIPEAMGSNERVRPLDESLPYPREQRIREPVEYVERVPTLDDPVLHNLLRQTREPRVLPAQPYEMIDLTSSPEKPLRSRCGPKFEYVPVTSYPTSRPISASYVPVPSRASPLRNARGAYYEVPGRELVRAHISEPRRVEERSQLVPRLRDNAVYMKEPAPYYYRVEDGQDRQPRLRYHG